MTDGPGGAGGRVVVDGRPIEFRAGDSLAIAIVRGGEVPGRGGTLCLAGDCGNCLAEVDGVAYVRTCQTPARPGTVVARHPAEGKPALPTLDGADLTRSPLGPDVPVRRVDVAVAVIGGGPSG
ncbi:MAG TPA: 2Fe-2S iron-sulfur cluster-binding protein, partial [Verrucomicrobiae bacterium]|nr:2Fe-2S iron-sulfur cluster-binding protein [Verrucomicrobiae bacterium]